MRKRNWLFALMALMACGLIAAGCGDDDDDSGDTTATTEETTAEDTTAEDTTSEDTDTEATGSTPDDVYTACIDAFEGVPEEGQAAVETACAQARDAFEQCAEQAESVSDEAARETALAACQDAADQTVESLEGTF